MKKAISLLLLTVLLITALTGTAMAAEKGSDAAKTSPYYLSITGAVVDTDGAIKIEDQNGSPATLIVDEKTVYPFESEISKGDTVTGYYLANAPMMAIWPPQYNIAVLAVGAPEGDSVKVDRFSAWADNADGYMLAYGGAFAFRMNDETEVVLADGKDFKGGDIENRRLVVIYDASTKSIPELATARKVIVLFEDAVPLPELLPEDIFNVSEFPILVDGVKIDAPAAFMDGDAVMVPLRAIAEALGYDVKWDAAARAVTLDGMTKVVIGQEVVAGSPAPVIADGVTYVPLRFFIDALDMANAYSFEGQIEIQSTGERME